MTDQLTRIEKDTGLLLSYNHELELLYLQQHNPCTALQISHNYNLLQQTNPSSIHLTLWRERAKAWWEQYKKQRLITGDLWPELEKINYC